MDLIYRDPATGALHMRCDAGARAHHMIRESAVTEVHIYDSMFLTLAACLICAASLPFTMTAL